MARMTDVTVTVEQAALDALTGLAARLRVSRALLVRLAIDEYLERHASAITLPPPPSKVP